MPIFVEDQLICPIVVLDGKKTVSCLTIGLKDVSTLELYEARAASKDGEFWGLHEIAAKGYLVAADGKQYPLLYESLAATSSANFKVIEQLDNTLSLKLKAESLLTPSN
ncbi:MAG: hypothetical protein RSC68_05130 [Acinetobacter sp.]